MKHLAPFILAIFLLSGCLSMDIGFQASKNVDFGAYKTFAWVYRAKQYKHADAKIDNDIVEGQIIRHVNEQLGNRGLRVDTINPDMLLDYDIFTEQKSELAVEPTIVSSVYYGQPYVGVYSSFSSSGSQTIYYGSAKTTYQNGTVIIYVADKNRNRLIWQAWADGSVENIRAFQKELPKDIHAMFRHFPLKDISSKGH
jgi:hypothetical protein